MPKLETRPLSFVAPYLRCPDAGIDSLRLAVGKRALHDPYLELDAVFGLERNRYRVGVCGPRGGGQGRRVSDGIGDDVASSGVEISHRY